MSNPTDLLLHSLVHDSIHNTNIDFSSIPDDLIEQLSNLANSNEDFPDVLSPATLLLDNNAQTPGGFSPENNSNSNNQELSTIVSNAAAFPSNMQPNATCLQMIAQPFYGTKLRYRSDYAMNENRLGVLKNKNTNSSYQGPAISIPPVYLDPNGQYYIRVSLVTVIYDKTNLQYFHPYEIEDPKHEEFNDRLTNTVWLPIEGEDCITGIKSFPSLRIVKKKASELKSHGDLRVFDCNNRNLQDCFLPQFSASKDTINEYNLGKSQLAFSVGQRVQNNGQISINLYSDTTVYSDEMIEGVGKESEAENDTQSMNGRQNTSPSICRVYNYAPRSGFAESNDDMLIFLTTKLEPKKYGDLNVVFQCDTSHCRWSESVVNLDIKDRMVAFKTPIFPHSFENTMPVDVILRQNNRDIGTLKYFYLSTLSSCSACQANAVRNQTNVVPNVPNKRGVTMMRVFDDQHDGVVPASDGVPALQHSTSEPTASSSSTASNFTSLPAIHLPETRKPPYKTLEEAFEASVEALFKNNDDSLFLRLCRPVIKLRPELCHVALSDNHTEILLKFIPVFTVDILRCKNEFGETFLLHAARLNRTEIIKALLEKKDSEILLDDVDKKNNNIFHILALNSSLQQIFDLLINYLLEKNIPIQQKFDQSNQDHQTPLQLAVYKNNLMATKSLLKYFNTNICETVNRTGDNLIHLAVRHCDLAMVKYLIEDGKLTQQGNQSNLSMTPVELARSLKRNDDVIEYLNEKYSLDIIDQDDNSDDD